MLDISWTENKGLLWTLKRKRGGKNEENAEFLAPNFAHLYSFIKGRIWLVKYLHTIFVKNMNFFSLNYICNVFLEFSSFDCNRL